MEAPENGHAGTRTSLSEKPAGFIIQLMCLYTSVCSRKNKQEILKARIPQENCDLVTIPEAWCDDITGVLY